jgi:hypothetical protein
VKWLLVIWFRIVVKTLRWGHVQNAGVGFVMSIRMLQKKDAFVLPVSKAWICPWRCRSLPPRLLLRT